MSLIDLTRKIYEGMPVYPGDPQVSLAPLCTHETVGYQVTGLSLGSHTGTHVDCPRHFLKSGAALAEVPLDAFVGEAVCVRGRLLPPANSVAAVAASGSSDEAPCAAHPVIDLPGEEREKIRPGDRVIVSTGWEAQAGSEAYFLDFPIFSADLVSFLLSREIRMLGIDIPTVVSEGPDREAMHIALLSRGIVIVEGLVNLEAVTGKRFFFSAAPLPLENGDGSPVRAYAML